MWIPAEFGRPYATWQYVNGCPVFYRKTFAYVDYHKRHLFVKLMLKTPWGKRYFHWRMQRALRRMKNDKQRSG